jgi:hypothetical protein
MLAHVPEIDSVGQCRPSQRAGTFGDQDLPAVAGRADTGRAVHVDADISTRSQCRLACMKAHAHPDRDAVGPRMIRDIALRLHRPRDRAPGLLERDEERVALRVDLDPAHALERRPHEAVVFFEDVLIGPVADPLKQIGGALYVGKEETDRAGGQRTHDSRLVDL